MTRRFCRPLTRRDFLKATASTFAATGLVRGAQRDHPHVGEAAAEGRSPVPVGVQLYCFRHLLEQDFDQTLAQVATLGYAGVEFAGWYDYADRPAELRALLSGHGLQVAGAHLGLPVLEGDELQRSIDFHGELGNTNLIVAGLAAERRTDRDEVLRTAETFTAIQEELRKHGMRTGYHCHAYSFRQDMGGDTVWDLIAQNTPSDMILQLDTGNAANGGADVVKVINDNPGRINSMHVKPYLQGAEEPFEAFIGDDGLPWQQIFDRSEEVGGIEWYVVEYEYESYPPLEALKANRERVAGFGR